MTNLRVNNIIEIRTSYIEIILTQLMIYVTSIIIQVKHTHIYSYVCICIRMLRYVHTYYVIQVVKKIFDK